MNREIEAAIKQVREAKPANLDKAIDALTTLASCLRKEVEAHMNVLGNADASHAAFSMASSDLVSLLQLMQVSIETAAELGKLKTSAGKTIKRILKKVPK